MPHRPRSHRRGGSLDIRQTSNVTTWGGRLLDPRCRSKVKVGDSVRIILDGEWPRYILITNTMGKQYLRGFVDDPYYGGARYTCNVCYKRFDRGYNEHFNTMKLSKGCEFYSCDGDPYNNCDFHCHKSCIPKITNEDKSCNCKLERIPYQDGDKMIFKRNNISEIPSWSKNTYAFDEYYPHPDPSKRGRGYAITGVTVM